MLLHSKTPSGSLDQKWDRFRRESKLVGPNNKRRYRVLVVGTGLAGASASATLGELGYHVETFTFHDSPRRAHSVAAQGGINAAKNYQGDGDSVDRLFHDTIKGGDFRSREANVYRLAQVSNGIIDQCVAQGVPFAREYGGLLQNRSFGGALVSRTFYARGQTGQQLLLGAYASLNRQVANGRVRLHTHLEMLDLIVHDGSACGIVTRDLRDGTITSHFGDAVVLCTGGYSNVFFLSTNASGCNATAIWRAHKRGAVFANPCFTQIHPTCIPPSGETQSKLTLMSESLRNDGRIWVPKRANETRSAGDIPEGERDYYLETRYPAYGNLAPRDIASRAAKAVCDDGRGVSANGLGVYLDFSDAIARLGEQAIRDRYGNLFHMYEQITGENPYRVPMRIHPAPHYTMGGLWVDYELMTTVPGLFACGEANFSDHGANRLGASALMQGLADGYFVLPATIGNYLTGKATISDQQQREAARRTEDEVQQRLNTLLSIGGRTPVEKLHRDLGNVVWEACGMSRTEVDLLQAIVDIRDIRERFYEDASVTGVAGDLNMTLEKAGRVADLMELGELMCRDALARDESCGAHFRTEHQTEDGEAVRNDKDFCHVAAWAYTAADSEPIRHVEELEFDSVDLAVRSYK